MIGGKEKEEYSMMGLAQIAMHEEKYSRYNMANNPLLSKIIYAFYKPYKLLRGELYLKKNKLYMFDDEVNSFFLLYMMILQKKTSIKLLF